MDWWLQAAITLLAAYGAIAVIQGLWRLAAPRRARGRPQLSVVVIMQDQERTAEGLIGELLAGQATAGLVTDIVAVDLGSRDNTPAILQRIARQHGHVRSVLMPPGTSSEEAVAAAVKQCRSPLQLCLDASRTRDLGLVRQTLAALGLDPAAASPPATESHSA